VHGIVQEREYLDKSLLIHGEMGENARFTD
jgi:hypothetical protein